MYIILLEHYNIMQIQKADAETETHRLCGLPRLSQLVSEAGLEGM